MGQWSRATVVGISRSSSGMSTFCHRLAGLRDPGSRFRHRRRRLVDPPTLRSTILNELSPCQAWTDSAIPGSKKTPPQKHRREHESHYLWFVGAFLVLCLGLFPAHGKRRSCRSAKRTLRPPTLQGSPQPRIWCGIEEGSSSEWGRMEADVPSVNLGGRSLQWQ